MRHLFLSFFIWAASLVAVSAQPKTDSTHKKGEQKIKALYAAFMTQELNLSEEDAQKFWPIHRQFDSEMRALHQKPVKDPIEKEEEAVAIKKKYRDKFIKAIGNERAQDFFKKDAEFRMRMFERIKNFRKNGSPGKPNSKKSGHPMPPPPPPPPMQ